VSGGPPDDAYGRVTNPERYAPLHGALDDIVASLERRFRLTRTYGLHLDEELASLTAGSLRVVRLEPAAAAAAPITASWTTFPGVLLRLGRYHVAAFPSCGCDACDEDPMALINEMSRQVEAVTRGRFSEWADRARVGHAFELEDGARRSGWSLSRGETGVSTYTDIAWAPWPVAATY
jgi:hypothetical protein